MIKQQYTRYVIEKDGFKIYAEVTPDGKISLLPTGCNFPMNNDSAFYFIGSKPKDVKKIIDLMEEALTLVE